MAERKEQKMEWKQFFRKHILERGMDYFLEGAVEDLEVTEDDITATVYGTEAYDVEITLCEGEIEDMYCSCPYAESGEYCKHMAAVLYEWEHRGETDQEEAIRPAPGGKESAEELVEQADPAVVKKFLVGLLKGDARLLSKFRTLTVVHITKEDMRRYERLVDRTVREYSGSSGYVSYRDAYGFIQEMERYLHDDVEVMIEKGCLGEAFELTGYIFLKVSEVEMDDSDGGQETIGSTCRRIWEEILEQADADTEHAMFEWFLRQMNGSVIDYMEEWIEEFVMEHFRGEPYLKAKLDFSENRARKAAGNSDYTGEKWAMIHISLMEEAGEKESSIRGYCREHWQYPDIRQRYVSLCVERKDYEEAVAVLKESLRLDASKPGLVRKWSQRLKEVYREAGETAEYKKQLWELVTRQAQGELEEFRELKSLYGEQEWDSVREKVFAALSPYAGIEKLYREEGLYDRLLDRVVSAEGLYKLQEYEADLKDLYPREILEKYTAELTAMARRTADRRRYQEWVALLKRMKGIKGGEEQVVKIVNRWKSEYANRPAMMDELKRL